MRIATNGSHPKPENPIPEPSDRTASEQSERADVDEKEK